MRIQRKGFGTMGGEDEQAASDCQILPELNGLVWIAELVVKNKCGRNTEERQCKCRQTGIPSDGNKQATAHLEYQGGDQQKRWHAELREILRRRVVIVNDYPAVVQKGGRPTAAFPKDRRRQSI